MFKNNWVRNLAVVYGLLLARERQAFVGLIFMGLLVTLSEVASLGLLFPIIGAVLDQNNSFLYYVSYTVLRLDRQVSVSEVCLAFGVVVWISIAIKIFHLYLSNLFVFKVGARLASLIYGAVLKVDYENFQNLTRAEIMSTLVHRSYSLTSGLLLPFVLVLSSTLILMGMAFLSFWQLEGEALGVIGVIGLIYVFVVIGIRQTVTAYGEELNHGASETVRQADQGFSNIKNIILGGLYERYVTNYEAAELAYRTAKFKIQLISNIPRFVIEGLIFTLIVGILAFNSSSGGDIGGVLVALASLTIIFQRSVPQMNQIFQQINVLQSENEIVTQCLSFVHEESVQKFIREGNREDILLLENFDTIEIKSVNFSYTDSDYDLNIPTLAIKRGSKNAIVGDSGCGKTTILDLVAGLLTSQHGSIFVDGMRVTQWESLRSIVGYLHQDPFLVGLTPLEAICGEDNPSKTIISDVRLKEALRFSGCEFLLRSDGQPDHGKLTGFMGENGTKLSGGQRLRVAIANCIYNGRTLLLFDEPTSSLDRERSNEIMENICDLDQRFTVLVVTHDVTCIPKFDNVFTVSQGHLVPYDHSDRFRTSSILK